MSYIPFDYNENIEELYSIAFREEEIGNSLLARVGKLLRGQISHLPRYDWSGNHINKTFSLKTKYYQGVVNYSFLLMAIFVFFILLIILIRLLKRESGKVGAFIGKIVLVVIAIIIWIVASLAVFLLILLVYNTIYEKNNIFDPFLNAEANAAKSARALYHVVINLLDKSISILTYVTIPFAGSYIKAMRDKLSQLKFSPIRRDLMLVLDIMEMGPYYFSQGVTAAIIGLCVLFGIFILTIICAVGLFLGTLPIPVLMPFVFVFAIIFFVFYWLMAIVTASYTLLLSDFCVSPIENIAHILDEEKVHLPTNRTNEQVVNYYALCEGVNPFESKLMAVKKPLDTVSSALSNVIKLGSYILAKQRLSSMQNTLENIDVLRDALKFNCTGASRVYKHAVELFCGNYFAGGSILCIIAILLGVLFALIVILAMKRKGQADDDVKQNSRSWLSKGKKRKSFRRSRGSKKRKQPLKKRRGLKEIFFRKKQKSILEKVASCLPKLLSAEKLKAIKGKGQDPKKSQPCCTIKKEPAAHCCLNDEGVTWVSRSSITEFFNIQEKGKLSKYEEKGELCHILEKEVEEREKCSAHSVGISCKPECQTVGDQVSLEKSLNEDNQVYEAPVSQRNQSNQVREMVVNFNKELLAAMLTYAEKASKDPS